MSKVVLFAVLVLFGVTPTHAASLRASCHDPRGVSDLPGEWVAEYDTRADADGLRVVLRDVYFRADDAMRRVSQPSLLDDARWQLSAKRVDLPGYDSVTLSTRELLDDRQHAALRRFDLYPVLQTPNRHCTLFLRSYQYLPQHTPRADAKKVAIVGDSLTQKLTASIDERRKLAFAFALHNLQLEVYALGGMTWQRAPGTPEGDNLLDEIRGLLATDPDVFVFALGTNDALQITRTRIEKTAYTTEHMRRYTALQIGAILREVDAASPAMCKVLVTPSIHPFYIFGQYSEEAAFVGDVLRFFAGQPTQTDIAQYVRYLQPFRNLRVADWATLSAGKDKLPWFPDGIHMTDEGAQAFVQAWLQTIGTCPPR